MVDLLDIRTLLLSTRDDPSAPRAFVEKHGVRPVLEAMPARMAKIDAAWETVQMAPGAPSSMGHSSKLGALVRETLVLLQAAVELDKENAPAFTDRRFHDIALFALGRLL